ncbi:TetR/AcrR family transcriptional regulator [Mycolicibacterium sp.]|uniref:TetR/AcrR family transcriptional regulator n=1 Tax=Mycolicibacterium sp. TaxID=2320850 RepID=UPI003D0BE846
MPKPTQRSSARHELVLEQLMGAAETLFARQGVAGTSLVELAEAVGLTRTGVYHYVSGKDELLEHLVRGFSLVTANELQALADDSSRPAAERLRAAVVAMAARVAEHPQRFRVLLTSEEAFPPTLAKQHHRARRKTFTALSSLVSQGIADGSVNPVDPDLTALSLAGVANWVAFWYPRKEPAPQQTPQQVAEALADIALGGVINPQHEVPGEGAIPQALAGLRSYVQRLELLLDAGGRAAAD